MVEKPREKGQEKSRHEEHIIQNSLYGRLKSNTILCEECGGELNRQVDSKFVAIFECFTEPIKNELASKHHGNNNAKPIQGYVILNDGRQFVSNFKNGKVTPVNPFWDINEEKEVKIYANQTIIDDYQKKVLSDLKKEGINPKDVNFERITNIEDHEAFNFFFSEGKRDFNRIFRLGITKIALEFALHSGIQRESLAHLIESKTKQLKECKIIPFLPLGIIDTAVEPVRMLIEKNFPTHTLVLFDQQFSDRRVLFCYIDLFSTFQYYAILNEDYKGEKVCENYYQTILKQKKKVPNIRGAGPKEIMILAQDLDIEIQVLEEMGYNEIYDFLESSFSKRKINYQMNLNGYIKGIADYVSRMILLKSAGNYKPSTEWENEVLKLLPEVDIYDLQKMSNELRRIEAENTTRFYKQDYYSVTEDHNTQLLSYPDQIMSLNPSNFDWIREYTYLKFYQLNRFINDMMK